MTIRFNHLRSDSGTHSLEGFNEPHLYHPAGWGNSPWMSLLHLLLPEISSQRLVIHGVPEDSPLTEVISQRAPAVRFVD